MKNNRNTTYEKKFNGKSINTNEDKDEACDIEILNKIDNMFNHYTNKHNKTTCVRVDLTYPEDHPESLNNKDFSKFASTFSKDLKRKGYDPAYIAVREHKDGEHQHYHVAVLCDGNKTQFPHKVTDAVTRHWNRAIGIDEDQKGCVDYCTKFTSGKQGINCYRLRRNDEDFDQVVDDCFKRCSYLAKVNTKGSAPHRTREVFTSRIPKD